jgi:hypothetical protein
LITAAAVAFALVVGVGFRARLALAAEPPPPRQVTLFGVIASSKDRSIDPKLVKVAPQLRKILPGHGFRLLDVHSKRLKSGETLNGDLGDGFSASATLIPPADDNGKPAEDNGKVRIRCAVQLNQATQLETVVTTPPNQLFFCDKALSDGTRLLIGIGAR